VSQQRCQVRHRPDPKPDHLPPCSVLLLRKRSHGASVGDTGRSVRKRSVHSRSQAFCERLYTGRGASSRHQNVRVSEPHALQNPTHRSRSNAVPGSVFRAIMFGVRHNSQRLSGAPTVQSNLNQRQHIVDIPSKIAVKYVRPRAWVSFCRSVIVDSLL
jgi:hypothetical protein